jgi:hypothetical protein
VQHAKFFFLWVPVRDFVHFLLRKIFLKSIKVLLFEWQPFALTINCLCTVSRVNIEDQALRSVAELEIDGILKWGPGSHIFEASFKFD